MFIKDRYINPFTDFGFKKIFGSEVNKELLIAFLNTLLPPEAGTVADLSFLPNEQVGRSEYDRRAIFDLYCENEKGEKFIVEMQRAKQNYFKDRSVFYATFPIQQQAQSGDWNFCLKAVYMVGILDFVFDVDKADDAVVHHEVRLIDRSTGAVFYDKLTFIYLELPKFLKTIDELVTDFDKWCFLLRHLSELTDRPARLQEKVFLKVFELAEIAQYSSVEAAAYEESLKVYRDLKNVVDTAFDEGIAEGIVKGKAEGIAEGIQQKALEDAKRFKDAGVDIETIARCTGLPVTLVEGL
jgi:predicted transposase/invertase (TIGR01784 family)